MLYMYGRLLHIAMAEWNYLSHVFVEQSVEQRVLVELYVSLHQSLLN